MLLLNALALDLARGAVGTMEELCANVVGGVVLLPLDPVEDAIDDGVDDSVEDGELNGGEEVLEPLDPFFLLKVDSFIPPMPIALEFVPVLAKILELEGEVDLCEAGDNDDEDLFGNAPPPVVLCILVPPDWEMYFRKEDVAMLPSPMPKRTELMRGEGEDDVGTPVPLLRRVLGEPPIRPLVVSLGWLEKGVG